MKALDNPFNSLRSFGIGFDQAFKNFQQVEELMTQSFQKLPGYPPFNIKKVTDDKYVIEMAVAGFGKSNIEVETANGVLTISGKVDAETEDAGVDYLYKGIANRSFTRKIALADTIEIKNAELVNGMLKIWLDNLIPESKKPRKIDINEKSEKGEPAPSVTSWFTKEKEEA